ncbi:MAG: hypothetical protein ACRDA4_03760 [Filifactoraceae bacterium]
MKLCKGLKRENCHMKNKYVPIAMWFLIISIVLNKISVNNNYIDFVSGATNGLMIGILLMGIYSNRKNERKND